MAFKIVKQQRAWWPVKFASANEDGGVTENTFEMRFNILFEDAQGALVTELENLRTGGDPSAPVPTKLATDIVLRIAEDWRGVMLDDGTDAGVSMPFTPENIALLMDVPNVFSGVTAAYRACREGRAEARRGN